MVAAIVQEDHLSTITQEFLEGLPEQLGGIEVDWVRVRRGDGSSAAIQPLAGKLHALAGSAASLGFENIAQDVSRLQALIQKLLNKTDALADSELFSQLEASLGALRQSIYTDQQIPMDKLKRKLGLTKIASSTLQEKRGHRLIYLVEDDPIQARELAEQIGYFGYTVQSFSKPSELEETLHQLLPTAILMDVSFPEGSMLGYEAIGSLRAQFPDLPPIIFITINDQMPFRLQAVRVGGQAYFTKPVDVGALVDVLDRLILHNDIPPFRVLIVDDSRVQANFSALQLKKAGILTEIVSNPIEVIDHMINFNPDLLLLDIYMPDCTGMELARVIRQMEQFISVPIVYLSAELDKDKQLAALGLGGDDFLTKPIDPEHLVTAVTTRIERYRNLRALMIQDGLTGLLNHSTTKERLVDEVNRAKRQNSSFSLAMIDLDLFKTVNDSYGHATGDRVLKSLAFLFKQRLRSTDTIGRIGGEEFAILLPDTDEKTTKNLMTDLCEGFARVRHYSGDQEFSVTFSCGIACYPDQDNPDSLSEAADAALYTAKALGRNRVIAASETKIQDRQRSKPDPRVQSDQPDDRHLAIRPDIAKQGRKAETDLAQTLAYLSALNRISQSVMNLEDLPTIVTEVSREVVGLFNAQHVGISLLVENNSMLEYLGDSQDGWDEVSGKANRIRLLDDPGSAQVIQTSQSILISEATTNPLTGTSQSLLSEHGIHTRLIVPLVSHSQAIGTMNIDFESADPGVVTIDIELAETIAASIASVIENSRLLTAEQRQRQYYQALVSNIPAAVVTIDSEAIIHSWNPAARHLFGYTEAEAIGQNIDELLTSEAFRQESLQYTQETIETGQLLHAITRRKRKDGNLAEVELFAVPVFVKDRVLAIYHDITDLQQARRDAEAANEAKSAFLATMSHEIRTPLNAIVGMTTLLLDSQLTDEQREFSETVRTSSDALLAIINDILDFSKIEAGKMELEEQAFDLRECVESALDLVAGKANEKGIDLAYMIDPEVPSVIISDSTRLRQILLNLLSNSLKFTEAGEVVLSVSADKLNEDSHKAYQLSFAVRDTGIGIPAERKERLFRSFSQLDASTTRKYGGTGLGLAISKRLCELMGGKMWVESEGVPGKGSTFSFTIFANKSTSPLPVFMNVRQPVLTGKHVLIVDDNATNRYLLVRQVQSWGMTSQETAYPRQALKWIQEGKKFDLALLDMQMPEMDGTALAYEIVNSYRHKPELPMIMLTSLGFRDPDSAGIKFAAYLTKPIKPAHLHAKLLEVFGGRPQTNKVRLFEPARIELNSSERIPLRILLAEDTLVNQRVALLLLERIGYRADVAGNGYEVLEALCRQSYDLILMDIQMPEMDGLEAARMIRAGEWLDEGIRDNFLNQPYIIAMTANAMQGDREICMAAGMDDYISKPIRVEELTQVIQGAVRFRQERLSQEPGQDGIVPDWPDAAIDEAAFQNFCQSIGAEHQDFVGSLIQDYLDEASQILNELREAIEHTNLEKIRRNSHSLKSSSMLLGAVKLAELCKSVENHSGDNGLMDYPDQLRLIEIAFEEVEDNLRAKAADLAG